MKPVKRNGKPRIWVTWLAKLLSGESQCVWSAWFKAHHYKYEKYEPNATNLASWAADHDSQVARTAAELRKYGWSVSIERENEIEIVGATAEVAGKPDIVARCDDRPTLVIDEKTGTPKSSDKWQVLVYLYGLKRKSQEEANGAVRYGRGLPDVNVYNSDLTPLALAEIVRTIKELAGDIPPPRTPSKSECAYCNIGPGDCPDKVMPVAATVNTTEF